jgi:5-methylcytosine-specific restriction endonuclease McrA
MVIKTEKDYLKKWKEQGAIKIENGVISIEKWSSYQSEYNRQKPHRQKEFVDKREQIKNRDDYTCQKCYKTEEELEVPLCIHHIDNNPDNNETNNLITLCMSCHSALLKKNVHFTKESERLEQEKEFREKVQQKSSIESSTVEERRKKKEVRSKKKEETKNKDIPPANAVGKINCVKIWIDEWNARIGSKTVVIVDGKETTKKYIPTDRERGNLKNVADRCENEADYRARVIAFLTSDNFANDYTIPVFLGTLNSTKNIKKSALKSFGGERYGKDY